MLTLPATNDAVLAGVINPALAYLPEPMRSNEARCLLLAIGRQESGFSARQQINGPARGFFQFERNGVLGVMHNLSSAEYVARACRDFGLPYGSTALYEAIATDDMLAAVLARLLLWCDPRPLPAIGDCLAGYEVYERCWRPGKPSYTRWKQTAYPQALEAIRGAST